MIVRDTESVDVGSFMLYVTEEEQEDSLIELENYSIEEAIEEAQNILELQDAPSVITLFSESKDTDIRTLESQINEDGDKEIIIHDL